MSKILQEQYVEMVLGKERYAMNTQDVYKIIKMDTIYDAPRASSYVKGSIYLRDKVIPVISMRSLFGKPEIPYTQATRIIIHKYNRDTIGLIVDQVNKVSSYEEIKSAPDKVGLVSGVYFRGIAIYEGATVGILNIDKIIVHA
jgi:purine-binding chemotaxis protein CheW